MARTGSFPSLSYSSSTSLLLRISRTTESCSQLSDIWEAGDEQPGAWVKAETLGLWRRPAGNIGSNGTEQTVVSERRVARGRRAGESKTSCCAANPAEALLLIYVQLASVQEEKLDPRGLRSFWPARELRKIHNLHGWVKLIQGQGQWCHFVP